MGLMLTVMAVPNGRFAQFTTTGIGLVCCAEMTASGVDKTPVGDAETGKSTNARYCQLRQLTCRWNNDGLKS